MIFQRNIHKYQLYRYNRNNFLFLIVALSALWLLVLYKEDYQLLYQIHLSLQLSLQTSIQDRTKKRLYLQKDSIQRVVAKDWYLLFLMLFLAIALPIDFDIQEISVLLQFFLLNWLLKNNHYEYFRVLLLLRHLDLE